jgi:pimeloyl-ACP methyl ester carboxylesterase
MVSSSVRLKLVICAVPLIAAVAASSEKREELTQSRDGSDATQDSPPVIRGSAKPTFFIHGYEGVNEAREFGTLKAEFEKRGFPCKIIRSPRTKTPNRDRTRVMVEALKNVDGQIVLVGISNQGLFMPLVAAERPIRRIVMINAVVPTPGKSFREAFDFKEVFATPFTIKLAENAPGMLEVCPLKQMPSVEYVYVCGEKDDAIRPEWEQRTAREYLHVEPIVVKGAGHGNIVTRYAKEVVDAATKGF